MKKTFTLISAMLLSVAMYAFPGESKLSISSIANAPIRVTIDGNKYSSNNDRFVMINNLNSGYHSIKVYQQSRWQRNNNSNGNYQLVYSANIYVRSQYHVDLLVNRFGRVFKDEQPIAIPSDDDDNDNWNGHQSWNNNNSNNRAMNSSSFNQFKQTLHNEAFENTRANIAKQVIASNYFTTSQVKEIVALFSFENTKLDIAKYAYKYCVDKENYFTVNDVFTFSSSKEDLLRYIQANQ